MVNANGGGWMDDGLGDDVFGFTRRVPLGPPARSTVKIDWRVQRDPLIG